MQTLPVIGPILRDTPFIHKIVNTLSNSGTNQMGGHAKKFEVWVRNGLHTYFNILGTLWGLIEWAMIIIAQIDL